MCKGDGGARAAFDFGGVRALDLMTATMDFGKRFGSRIQGTYKGACTCNGGAPTHTLWILHTADIIPVSGEQYCEL